MRVSLLALAVLSISSALSRAEAQTSPTLFVVDTTAQMSGRLSQHRKIDWVKTALPNTVRKLDGASPVALWAFGTNSAKKCQDTAELTPLQSADGAAAKFESALADVQPKAGRSPIFATIGAALKSVGDLQGKSVSVVVIAGTGDDCGGDVCSSAKAMQATYPGVKLMALGIGMSEQNAAAFTCATKAMGGAFLPVKTGADVEKGLRQLLNIPADVKGKKAAENIPDAPAAPAKPQSAQGKAVPPAKLKPQEKPKPAEEPNIVLSALPAEGAPPLEAGLTWRITKIITTPTGQQKLAEAPAWLGGGGAAKAKLGEGHYAVDVAYGLATGHGEITVGAGKLEEQRIVLNSGMIAVNALDAPKGRPLKGVFFTLYRQKAGGQREEIARSSAEPAIFQVNAGQYVLVATSGLAKLETTVSPVAGKILAIDMALNMGALEIKTLAAEGQEKTISAVHKIYAMEGGGAAKPILTLMGASPRIELPAGAYRLETSLGEARQVSEVTITAGETVSKAVALNVGEAKLHLAAQPQQPAMPEKICEIFASDDGRKSGPVGRAAGMDFSLFLKAGVYDVECKKKGAANLEKTAQIKIAPGEVATSDLTR